MDEQLAYLKSVVEGWDGIEPWRSWFARNAEALALHLPRSQFLRLKLHRIKAIPEVLRAQGIPFRSSGRYDWLGGMPSVCRDCGAPVVQADSFTWCPNGCFRLHALRR